MTNTSSASRVAMDIDAYGRYGRQCALADYLEVAALHGTHITQAAVAREIEENGWASLPRRQFLTNGNVDEDPEAWAESVFSVIRDRHVILGDNYPYSIDEVSIKLRIPDSDILESPYMALLAITVLHAWDLPVVGGIRPEDVLESLVARALENRGLKVSPMGAADRANRSFIDAVTAGGQHLGLNPMTDPRPRKRSVKDAGIDTLAGLTWIDGRRGGQWLFIGQATVGESNTWQGKLNEPIPPIWAEYMQEPLEPQAFLAVAHHVDDDHLEFLTASKRGLILDRLRLCPFMGTPAAGEKKLIKQLLQAIIE